MTREQRKRVQAELRRYGKKQWANGADQQRWRTAIEQAQRYYEQNDPIRSDLLQMRYFQKRTEQDTIDRLHIGRTTYQKAQDDLLSTIAIFAAQQGAR